MKLEEIILVLVSWAAHLSGYPTPEQADMPTVEFVDHAFFVKYACDGEEKCAVRAWYNDTGIVYMDQEYPDMTTAVVSGIAVHEFVHHLQYLNGVTDDCFRQREATAIQVVYTHFVTGLLYIYVPDRGCDFDHE